MRVLVKGKGPRAWPIEDNEMGTCFVIQPFDEGGKFDKRYEDVFRPAIQAAGLEPYRVDRDPSVRIPVEDIQSEIKASDACLADISADNPNVWFELGYAFAAEREVIIVCSDERTKFPFDVQHLSIIKYSTQSSSDFEELRAKIESTIKARLQRRETLGRVARIHSVTKVDGLDGHQIATLVSVAEELDEPGSPIPVYRIRQSMERAGFTNLATTLGLKALLDKLMLQRFEGVDDIGDFLITYRITDRGMAWLLENQGKLTLKQEARGAASAEIPF